MLAAQCRHKAQPCPLGECCCAEDPAADYMIVRQELALYNAEYCARPHIVALNKMDLEDAAELQDEVSKDIMAAAKAMQVSP